MKNYFCLCCLLLVVNTFGDKLDSNNANSAIDISNAKSSEGLIIDKKYQDRAQSRVSDAYFNFNYGINRGVYEKEGYDFGFDAGNPDIHGEIMRPCQVYDTFCIRKFFEEHSDCTASGRRLPDPFYRAQASFNYASANITIVADGLEYTGLNDARVAEFYINKKTDNLVIALTFGPITVTTKNGYGIFHLRGREPTVTGPDFGALFYLQTTVTFVIPGLNKLRLDRAEISTFADNPLPPFIIGPRIAASTGNFFPTDPEVLAMLAFLATINVRNELKEELSTEGNFYGINYLQYNICDFGFKVL